MKPQVLVRAVGGGFPLIIALVALIAGSHVVFAAAILFVGLWAIGWSIVDIRRRRARS